MKKITTQIISVILLLFGIVSNAQEAGNNFYFKNGVSPAISVKKLKLNESDNLPTGAEIKYQNQVKVLYSENDRVFFKYLVFPDDADKAIFNYDSNNKERTFSMSKDDFNNLTNTYFNKFRGFKYGAYTVPIRLRNSKGIFEFDSNLSLGANVLSRLSLNRFKEHLFIDLSFGIGLTKVNLNKENSNLGVEGSDFENIDVLSPTAFTLSFGLLLNLAENVNIGAYCGLDRLSTADNKAGWIYNKKPWLGIGVNVSFSGKANNSNSEK